MPAAKMPVWSLPSSAGGVQTSKDLKGSPYVLYFYPKDLTPGCTTEACDFSARHAALGRLGVAVFGVSPDPLKQHAKFIAKHGLAFPLLSDEDHSLAEQLGAWGRKKFMGREYDGVLRSTFLVAADGRIAQEWRAVKVDGHADQVLAAARELVATG